MGAQRVPDFFIAGHPKCGTTALYLMLKSHPQVFMPEVKEPRYFAADQRSAHGRHPPRDRPRTLEGYLALFAQARPEQLVGEASPNYLSSRVAAGAIAQVQPHARVIAILREPAAFLRSFHLQMVSSKVETETDLGSALALEQERSRGQRIPRGCHHPEALMYSEQVRYVEQLERFRAVLPAENVLVLIYEEFRSDNAATVRRVLEFLGLDEAAPVAAVETKPLKAVRSRRLHDLAGAARRARKNPAAAGRGARMLNALIPAPMRSDSFRAMWRRAVYRTPPAPDERLTLELRRRFAPEVQALSEYLGRDLVALWGYDRLDRPGGPNP
jgi:sulfotransferase family protein